MDLRLKQVVPLALLYSADGNEIAGRTRFQKLVFLAQEELDLDGIDLYQFIKYDYGPFSKELLDDLETFEYHGIIEIDSHRTFGGDKRYDHRLTELGRESYEELIEQEEAVSDMQLVAEEIIEKYNSWSIRKLLGYIYEEYPEYRENSVIY